MKKAIGIDGCRAGWISACLENEQLLLFPTIEELVAHYGPSPDFLIDIPIGLPDKNSTFRTCENEARKWLPRGKKSSLFSVPCREAVRARDYREANVINRAVLGKGLSKQSWFISSKIRQVDDLLIAHPHLRPSFKESHPELAFHFLNGGRDLLYSKKTEEGIQQRLDILDNHNNCISSLYNKALAAFKRSQVAKDDIVDALCLALTSALLSVSHIPVCRFVSTTAFDAHGIEMAIYVGASASCPPHRDR